MFPWNKIKSIVPIVILIVHTEIHALNKILVIQRQIYNLRAIHYERVGFISVRYIFFNLKTSIYVVHHIKGNKQNHMIILIGSNKEYIKRISIYHSYNIIVNEKINFRLKW